MGGWSEQDFVRAMRRGRSPDRLLWPAFPFAFFTRMTDEDLADVWAFLGTVPPTVQENRAHDIRPGALARWAWHAFVFRPHRFRPPTGDPVLDRGAYLVEVVGHCQACHTPLTSLGRPFGRWAYTGASGDPYETPNLTPHADGLADWSSADWSWFLEMGLTPDGDAVGSAMRQVVRDGTSQLASADREALAAWMMSLPPRRSRPSKAR